MTGRSLWGGPWRGSGPVWSWVRGRWSCSGWLGPTSLSFLPREAWACPSVLGKSPGCSGGGEKPTTDKCSLAREERAGSSHPCAMPGMRSLSVDRAEVTTPRPGAGAENGLRNGRKRAARRGVARRSAPLAALRDTLLRSGHRRISSRSSAEIES